MAHRRGSTTELAALLASLDLSAFLPAFVEDNLDDRSLVSLREGDLRALGIPATARRRFLEAVEERRHVPEALEQLRRDRDVAWAEVARLRALLRRRQKPAAISASPYGVAERRSSFSPSPPPSPAPSLHSAYSQPQTSPVHMGSEPPTPSSTVTSFFRSTSQLTLPRIDDRRRTGRVLWFKASKFGFLSQDSGEPDVFAHASDFVQAYEGIQEGDRVEYSLAEFRGRPKAIEIVLLDPQDDVSGVLIDDVSRSASPVLQGAPPMPRVVLDRSVTRTSTIETTASLRASEGPRPETPDPATTASLRASEGPRPETPDPDETRRSDSTRGGGATDGVPSPRAEPVVAGVRRAAPVAAGAAAAPQLRPEASAWRALDAAAPTDAAEPKQGKPIGDEALPEARAAPESPRSRAATLDSSAHTRSSSDSIIEDPHAADRATAHAAVRLAKRAEKQRRQRKAKHERRRPSEIVLRPVDAAAAPQVTPDAEATAAEAAAAAKPASKPRARKPGAPAAGAGRGRGGKARGGRKADVGASSTAVVTPEFSPVAAAAPAPASFAAVAAAPAPAAKSEPKSSKA